MRFYKLHKTGADVWATLEITSASTPGPIYQNVFIIEIII